MKKQIINNTKRTIILDFDGVIHNYNKWISVDVIDGRPVKGAREFINELRKKYRVVIVSTRCNSDEGQLAIRRWLNTYKIEVDLVTRNKPPAVCIVDDRAIQFNGDFDKILKQIENFKVWWKQ